MFKKSKSGSSDANSDLTEKEMMSRIMRATERISENVLFFFYLTLISIIAGIYAVL